MDVVTIGNISEPQSPEFADCFCRFVRWHYKPFWEFYADVRNLLSGTWRLIRLTPYSVRTLL